MAKLGWTDKAAAEIAAAKAEAIGGGSNPGGNSQGGNSQSGNDSGDGPTNEPWCTLGARPGSCARPEACGFHFGRQTRDTRLN